MIHELFQVTCDSCGRDFRELFDNIKDCLKYPPKEGWQEKQVENGSYWYFCPKCLKEENGNK